MKTEIRNEFILEAHKSACSEWKLKIEKECPELFENKLEVGKWYKEPSDLGNKYRFIFIEKIDNKQIFGYGFKGDGSWFENDSYYSGGFILATEEEVKEALIKEAKKRGFKNGVVFRNILRNHTNKIEAIGVLNDYKKYDNSLWFDEKGCVFKDGKWATIISNPIEEKIKKYERKIEELKKQL